jgi:hypothetical protein
MLTDESYIGYEWKHNLYRIVSKTNRSLDENSALTDKILKNKIAKPKIFSVKPLWIGRRNAGPVERNPRFKNLEIKSRVLDPRFNLSLNSGSGLGS